MKTVLALAFLEIISGCNKPVASNDVPATPSDITTASDVSNLEESHRASDPNAPLDQPKNPADEEITLNIRKKMMETRMSPNLQNVHVSTQDGIVKLRGTVKSEEEKEKVEAIARTTDGAQSVDSQIEVE